MRPQAKSTLWATLFFALLGLIWCGYAAFPTTNPAPCVTSGCALFRDSKFAGVSLWWVGGAYFFLLAVLCLRGNRSLARIMARLALFADAVLLVIMFLTAPCFDCLVVAAIMGLCYFTLKRPAPEGWFAGVEITSSLLLPVWFGLFLGNAVLAADEQIPLYAMGNARSTNIRIYFSPSCKACRGAISYYGNAATLYPVIENEQDFDSIVRLAALIKANVPVREAVLRSINQNEPIPPLALYERSILAVQLLRNKASLLRQGFRALPLVQVNGWQGEKPSLLEKPAAPAAPPAQSTPAAPLHGSGQPDTAAAGHEDPGFAAPEQPRPTLDEQLPNFFDPDALEQCGGNNSRPCN